jgi:prepilin-type N-terminal cleavage/methylation domain-containing protein
MRRLNKGFTLVELLVVIAIISILTIITVGQFQTAMKKAHDVARKGDLSALSKALILYYADLNKFPLAANLDLSAVGQGPLMDGSYIYMKVLPKEKYLTTPFCYIAGGNDPNKPNKFALFAQLENTVDPDCKKDGDGNPYYAACGKHYCYAITSPNTSLNADGTFN